MNKIVELISTGNELLSGRTLNRHAQTLARHLSTIGYRLVRDTTVGDEAKSLTEALSSALERVDVVVLSGGLGPTVDDITRDVVAEYLRRDVVMDPPALSQIRQRAIARGWELNEARERQALVVDGARALPNSAGAAPGEIIIHRNKVIILLPGPPVEFLAILEEHLLPWLTEQAGEEAVPLEQIFLVLGVGEADIVTRFEEAGFTPKNVDIAYCAAAGRVEVRLNASHDAESDLLAAAASVRTLLGDRIYSEHRQEIEQTVGELLLTKKVTVATAESCTGGLLGHRLTSVSGSSSYFFGGIIAYSNKVKVQMLGVDEDLLSREGAVSAPVAEQMALGVREAFATDYGMGITGIAGPTGGTIEKPVGLVFISIADAQGTETRSFRFGSRRAGVKAMSSTWALDMLRCHLLDVPSVSPDRKAH